MQAYPVSLLTMVAGHTGHAAGLPQVCHSIGVLRLSLLAARGSQSQRELSSLYVSTSQ
jgi:hypothetical protein